MFLADCPQHKETLDGVTPLAGKLGLEEQS